MKSAAVSLKKTEERLKRVPLILSWNITGSDLFQMQGEYQKVSKKALESERKELEFQQQRELLANRIKIFERDSKKLKKQGSSSFLIPPSNISLYWHM